MTSALNILHNCAKATENRQMFRDIRALERLAPFVKAENMETAISAVLTLSYITEENKTDLLEVGEIVSSKLGHVGSLLAGCNNCGVYLKTWRSQHYVFSQIVNATTLEKTNAICDITLCCL